MAARRELHQKVHQLDATSLFPSVMAGNDYPAKLSRWEVREQPIALAPSIRLADSICEVVLRNTDTTFPVRIDGATQYVCGTYKTTLAGPELAHAYKLGAIDLWGSWCEYETAPIFAGYVEHFWRLRQQFHAQGNSLYEQFSKLLLNSLYGKFGQRSSQWVHCPGLIPEVPWSQWTHLDAASGEAIEYRAIGERVERSETPGEIDGNFPAISAFVTSYARQRMRQLRQLLGPADLFYQGVDSLIVSQDGFLKLMAAGEVAHFELGKLRYERTADCAGIWGKHNYDFGSRRVAAGIKADAVDLGGGWFEQDRFRRVSSLFRQHVPQGVEVWTEKKRRQVSPPAHIGPLAPPRVHAWEKPASPTSG